MLELTFVKNHAIRKVFIKDKIVTLITPEFNYQTISFDEDKYNLLKQSNNISELSNLSEEELNKQDKKVVDLVNEIKYSKIDFNDEEALKQDLIKDFQETGWRCIKR